MPPPPPNRKRTSRFGRGARRRDEREGPKVEVPSGPLAGLTSQAPTKLSGGTPPAQPARPAAARPRPASQRLPVQRPATRRIPHSSGTARSTAPGSGEGEAGDSERVLVSAAPPDNSRQMMMIGGIGGGVLLLLIIIFAVASSGPAPRRRDSQPEVQPRRYTAAPPPARKPRRKVVNFHRTTGAIMFICANTNLHEDKEVVIRECPACGATAKFEWDKDAEHYTCKRCKGTVSQTQIECKECGRKPRVTRLKHGP